MKISDYLDSRLITFLHAQTRDDAIDELIDLLDEEGILPNKDEFRQAIFSREQIVSTGIGMGVAVPHAKLKQLPNFFIAVGIQQNKGLDWNALDQTPVRLVFMIGGPDNRQTEYLQILSLLTSVVRDMDLRKQLMHAQNADEVAEFLSDF